MKPVLEDIISGLMAGAMRATVGDIIPPPKREEAIIDLANEGAEE
jgi:hypothetical protein